MAYLSVGSQLIPREDQKLLGMTSYRNISPIRQVQDNPIMSISPQKSLVQSPSNYIANSPVIQQQFLAIPSQVVYQHNVLQMKNNHTPCILCQEIDFAQGRQSKWKEEFERLRSKQVNNLFVINQDNKSIKQYQVQESQQQQKKQNKYTNMHLLNNDQQSEKSDVQINTLKRKGKYTDYLNKNFEYDQQDTQNDIKQYSRLQSVHQSHKGSFSESFKSQILQNSNDD